MRLRSEQEVRAVVECLVKALREAGNMSELKSYFEDFIKQEGIE